MGRSTGMEIPAVRILPMSDRIPVFRGRSIADVQTRRMSLGGGIVTWGRKA